MSGLGILDRPVRWAEALLTRLASFPAGGSAKSRVRLAGVYQRGADILVHPWSKTTTGLWVRGDPCMRLSSDCPDSELGVTVLRALGESKARVAHPAQSQWGSLTKPLLKAAGVRSWGAFVRGTVGAEVEQDGDAITFTPKVNLGPREGFKADESKKWRMDGYADAEAVGEHVRRAISLSR